MPGAMSSAFWIRYARSTANSTDAERPFHGIVSGWRVADADIGSGHCVGVKEPLFG